MAWLMVSPIASPPWAGGCPSAWLRGRSRKVLRAASHSNSDIVSVPNITPLPFSLILISWPRAFGLMTHMAPRTFVINPDALATLVLPGEVFLQCFAESVQQIRPVADRTGRAKGPALPDPVNRSDAFRELVPDGVEAFGCEHAHARQFVRRLVGPVRQGVQVEPAPVLHQSELPQSRGLAGRGVERLGEPVSAVHVELAAPQAGSRVVDRGRTDLKGLDVADQTEVVVVPVGVAHEVIDHEPVVRGVARRPPVGSEAGGGADPLVMRVEAADGFD